MTQLCVSSDLFQGIIINYDDDEKEEEEEGSMIVRRARKM